MADVGPEHVAAAVKAAWDNSADARIYGPGGLWYGRVPQSATAPYARLTVTQGDTKRFGGGRYMRIFVVRVSAWSDTGPAGDASDLRDAVAGFMTRANLTVPQAAKVVDCKPGGNELGVDDSPRDANDVSLWNAEFNLTLEGR